MRYIDEYRKTSNRSIYNKTRKNYLSKYSKYVTCSFCQYHCGENRRNQRFYDDQTFPNWKLILAGKKQWDKFKRITIKQKGYGKYREF